MDTLPLPNGAVFLTSSYHCLLKFGAFSGGTCGGGPSHRLQRGLVYVQREPSPCGYSWVMFGPHHVDHPHPAVQCSLERPWSNSQGSFKFTFKSESIGHQNSFARKVTLGQHFASLCDPSDSSRTLTSKRGIHTTSSSSSSRGCSSRHKTWRHLTHQAGHLQMIDLSKA